MNVMEVEAEMYRELAEVARKYANKTVREGNRKHTHDLRRLAKEFDKQARKLEESSHIDKTQTITGRLGLI